MEIESLKELQAAQQLIGKRQYEVKKQRGISLGDARKIAAAEIGATYRPVLTGAEFESMVARARSRFYRTERVEGGKKSASRKPETVGGESLTALYEAWCTQNHHVAGDVELSHFAGCSAAAFSYARAVLIKSGFQFEKNGTGYNVKATEKPKYTERQWQERENRLAEIEKMLSDLRK
jgi:hypothetical protein